MESNSERIWFASLKTWQYFLTILSDRLSHENVLKYVLEGYIEAIFQSPDQYLKNTVEIEEKKTWGFHLVLILVNNLYRPLSNPLKEENQETLSILFHYICNTIMHLNTWTPVCIV